MRIAVTGGNGFIGKYFVEVFRRLNYELKKPIKLVVFDKNFSSKKIDKNIELIKKDLSKSFITKRRFDFIIHAVAFADKSELNGRYIDTTKDNFINCLEISCFSLTSLARSFKSIMNERGS